MNNNKMISREEFSDLLLKSVIDMQEFNKAIERLGITVKPYTGYEYYFGDTFICYTEDLCLDDLLEKAGFEIQSQ